MIDIINVITRSFLVLVIGAIAFLSRLSVTPVLEYDESRGKPEIVDRLILRDPTENEFILTICLMIAVGTSTEKIIIRFITAVISKNLDVDFQNDTREFKRIDIPVSRRTKRRGREDQYERAVDDREMFDDSEEGP